MITHRILRKEETFPLLLAHRWNLLLVFIVPPLTVLRDKSNTAVHNDGHAVLCQLLVAERVAVRAGGQRDGRVPQRKVCLAEAVDVDRPAGERKEVPDPSGNKVSFISTRSKETKVACVFWVKKKKKKT